MKFELVFTAYNRPQYFTQAINSWNSVRNLRNWRATFHIEPSPVQNIMMNMASSLRTNVGITVNETLQGVLVNPWNAIDNAFARGADFVVLAEDDVVVSQDTLEFFEWTAVEYATGHNVLCVNAFSQLGGGRVNQITLEDPKFSPLVWGIWRNRWFDVVRDTWDKDYSSGNEDGSEAGWDWNINRIIAAENLHLVKPLHSRSDHIGEELGTHMTPDLFPTSRGTNFVQIRSRQRYSEVQSRGS